MIREVGQVTQEASYTFLVIFYTAYFVPSRSLVFRLFAVHRAFPVSSLLNVGKVELCCSVGCVNLILYIYNLFLYYFAM